MSEPEPVSDTPYTRMLREHVGLVVTASYLVVSGVGMLSSWTFYRRFGLNIFEFTQLSDFFLVPLRQPLAAMAILAAAPAVWFILKSDVFLDRHIRWYKYIYGPGRLRQMSRTPLAWFLYGVLYAYAFSLLTSDYLADRVRGGAAPVVEAQLAGGQYLGRDASTPFRTTLLGTTTSFVFLYDQDTNNVTVVPIENVLSLSPRHE
jgi:hypothetical protein